MIHTDNAQVLVQAEKAIECLREELHALRLKFMDEKYPELLKVEAERDEWKLKYKALEKEINKALYGKEE